MASFKIGDFVKITPNCPYYPELIEDDTVLMVMADPDKDGEHRCCVYEDGETHAGSAYYPHPDYMVHCSETGDDERGIVAKKCEIIYDVHNLRVGDIVLILSSERGRPDEYYLGFVMNYSESAEYTSIEVIDTRTGRTQYITPANIDDGLVRYVHNSFDIYKDINIY